MPRKTVTFPGVRFSPERYQEFVDESRERSRVFFRQYLGTGVTLDLGSEESVREASARMPKGDYLEVSREDGTWLLDSVEDFIAELGQSYAASIFSVTGSGAFGDGMSLRVAFSGTSTTVTVEHTERTFVDREMAAWARSAEANLLPLTPPTVFLGHGGSVQWRIVDEYLAQLGYSVEKYETLSRVGYTIKEVLEEMLSKSDIAILVMTAEDEQGDGSVRARQNVVHETGLFQGHLGFRRTIVLLEEGTSDYSNIAGLQEIRYPANGIRAALGDIAVTLEREFPRPH